MPDWVTYCIILALYAISVRLFYCMFNGGRENAKYLAVGSKWYYCSSSKRDNPFAQENSVIYTIVDISGKYIKYASDYNTSSTTKRSFLDSYAPLKEN